MLLGIDEAGRGPVLGPLVICGCAIAEAKLGLLEELGLRDSKELKPEARRRLAAEIRKTGARLFLRSLSACKVDRWRRRGGLNQAESMTMVSLIRRLKPEKVYVDALTSHPGRFGARLAAAAGFPGVKIVAENRADTRYAIVQAAAIAAKVARDEAIERLKEEFGEVGSGYPSDPRTIAFLQKCRAAGSFPACVRTSWLTLDRLKEANSGAGESRELC